MSENTTLDYVLLLLTLVTCCCTANSCWFLADNRTGTDQQVKIELMQSEKMTGVITFDVNRKSDAVKQGIAFYKYNPVDKSEKAPLLLFTKENTFDILGSKDGAMKTAFGEVQDTPYGYTNPVDKQFSVQISDYKSEENRCYQVYVGKPGNTTLLKYGYTDNSELKRNPAWDQMSSVRLNSTTNVRSLMSLHINFISVCPSQEPRIDHVNPDTNMTEVKKGGFKTLYCAGSGAPYLDIIWDIPEIGKDRVEIVSYHNTTAAHHRVVSVLTITQFGDETEGNYTCRVRNKNFNSQATHTFSLVTECGVGRCRVGGECGDCLKDHKANLAAVWVSLDFIAFILVIVCAIVLYKLLVLQVDYKNGTLEMQLTLRSPRKAEYAGVERDECEVEPGQSSASPSSPEAPTTSASNATEKDLTDKDYILHASLSSFVAEDTFDKYIIPSDTLYLFFEELLGTVQVLQEVVRGTRTWLLERANVQDKLDSLYLLISDKQVSGQQFGVSVTDQDKV